MSQRERGVSPAKMTPKERWRRLPYPDMMQMRDRLLKEKGLVVAHQITSTFIIDQKGKPRIFREYRGGLVIHSFESLPQALDQIERVIQQKLGFQQRIGRVFIDIAGENEELVRIGTMLIDGVDKYYELPSSMRKAYSKSLARKAIPYLEKKHSLHKKSAAKVLRVILASGDEFKDDTERLVKAGKDAFDAAISGIRIVSGETVRMIGGQYYFELWGRQSLKIYEHLAGYYEQLKPLYKVVRKGETEEERKKLAEKAARKFKDQGSFWQKIAEVKANPFFKRFNSLPVNGLTKLPWALTTGRYGVAESLLADALKELSALERDFERGKVRLLPIKSTSKP